MKTNIIKIPKSKIKKGTCNVLVVPKEVCYIQFYEKRGKFSHNADKDYYTIRDEMFTMDMNEKDEIISIELLSSKKAKKPCMK
jgi:hypothetical protein